MKPLKILDQENILIKLKKMRFTKTLLGVLFLVLFSVAREETFTEKLTVWPMPNKFNLLEFEYAFEILLP